MRGQFGLADTGRERNKRGVGWKSGMGKEADSLFVEKLKDVVTRAKKNREWRHEYMTLQMRDQENLEMGMAKGQEMMLELIQKLAEDGRLAEISKIKENKDYCQQLFREYHIFAHK